VLMLLGDMGVVICYGLLCMGSKEKEKHKLARAAILSLRSFFCIEETFRCRKDLFYAVVFLSFTSRNTPILTYLFSGVCIRTKDLCRLQADLFNIPLRPS
jgi:hypothetical protein